MSLFLLIFVCFIIRNVFKNIINVAVKQLAEGVNRTGVYRIAVLDTIVVSAGKSHLFKAVRGYPSFFHRVKKRFVRYQSLFLQFIIIYNVIL